MKKNSEAHETLSLMFKRDGVPPRMIVDNSKEKSLGEFRRKCHDLIHPGNRLLRGVSSNSIKNPPASSSLMVTPTNFGVTVYN